MKTYIDCIPCNIEQCINTLNISGVSKKIKRQTVSELLNRLQHVDYNLPPAYNSDLAYQVCREITKINDPYKKLKKEYNQMALNIYPRLKKLVEHHPYPMYMAAKVAVEGNIIDLGISVNKGKKIDFDKILEEIESAPLAADDFSEFSRELKKAKKILYIGDNAGEIVFDRVFIEELVKLKKNVVFSVKSGPIINDSTMEDARQAGIHHLVKVIETGSDRSGVNFNYISDEFLQAFRDSDIVISKGQANFECLDEIDKNIYFILKAKCDLVAKRLKVNYLDVVLVKKRDQWGKKKV
ncbi:MAG: ARMT1-like domain-containing protein [Actinomycetia bacterium]|nr:ARMT1-like domain-containing protein [Actinomycetes bacterium]